MSIDKFTGEYKFLSNFYPSEVEFCGKIYPTVEHAYQAAKTEDEDLREQIRLCKTPGQTKRLGKSLPSFGSDWEEVKILVMTELLIKKFSISELRAKLLATGDAELIEGNYWHDHFWGVCNCELKGENNLGKLLMKIRKEISDGSH